MTDRPDRLYGLQWAEVLYLTPVDVYEHTIDGTYEPPKPVEIEEWTVCDNKQFMPTVERILEDLAEVVANEAISEEWYEAFENVEGDAEVVAAFQAALDLLASKVRFNMGDKVVASHWISWDAAGNPLLDGNPLYIRSGIERLRARLQSRHQPLTIDGVPVAEEEFARAWLNRWYPDHGEARHV